MPTEKIAEDVYQIQVPLPHTPLKITNSYLITSADRNLVIDTGFNCDESRTALEEAYKALKLDLSKTDFFITHLHADHSGLMQYFATPTSKIYMSRADGAAATYPDKEKAWSSMSDFFLLSGLLSIGFANDVGIHPGHGFAAPAKDNVTFLPDGAKLSVGRYDFVTVETPGHTRGQLCLYDQEKRIFFAGDHILGKITPNITIRNFDIDALREYLDSLDKVDKLDIDIIYPGHRWIIHDPKGRIKELKEHHDRRLNEVLTIIGGERKMTVDVARKMTWSLSYKDWDTFPAPQKLFSAGEALAHLYYLVNKGKLRYEMTDGVAFFMKVK